MSAYYAAGLDTVIEAMLPAAVRGGAALKAGEAARGGAAAVRRRAGRAGPARPAAGAALRLPRASSSSPSRRPLVLARLGLTAAVAAALVKRGAGCGRRRAGSSARAYADDWAARRGGGGASRPRSTTSRPRSWPPCAASLGPRHLRHAPAARGHRLGQDRGLPARRWTTALEAGGGVIFLVPEVALTPQTVARLRGAARGHRARTTGASSGTAT